MALRDLTIKINLGGNILETLKQVNSQVNSVVKHFQQLDAAMNKGFVNTAKSIDKVGKELIKLETRAKKATEKVSPTKQDEAAWIGLSKAAAGFFSLQAGGSFLADSSKAAATMETFNSVLKTTLGTQEKANKAMADVKKFSRDTPYEFEEIIGSYIKLTNRGMQPTMDEMIKLGDLASSQGKSFDQLTEAVLDATTAEFERLKEFGIRGTKEGNKVSLMFKNQKVTVDNNAEAIKKALLQFGAIDGVLGGMAERSKTFDGKLSNLKDTFAEIKLSVGNFINNALKPLLDFFIDGEAGLVRMKIAVTALALGITAALIPSVIELTIASASIIATFAGIAAGVTAFMALALVLEDVYYFATGGDNVTGGFLEKLGMSKEDIEKTRQWLANFIEGAKSGFDVLQRIGILLWKVFVLISPVLMFIGKILLYQVTFGMRLVLNILLFVIDVLGTIAGWFIKIASFVVDMYTAIVDFIQKVVNDPLKSILDMIEYIKQVFIQFGKPILVNVKEKIDRTVNQTVNTVSSGAQDLFASYMQPEAISSRVPGRASGGSVMGGKLYQINEKGIELFKPDTNGLITPSEKIQPTKQGSTYNISFQASGNRQEDDMTLSKLKSLFDELIQEDRFKLGLGV